MITHGISPCVRPGRPHTHQRKGSAVMKLVAMAAAVAGLAGTALAVAAPAQAAEAPARPHHCSITKDRLAVRLAHSYKEGNRWTVPVSITAKGKGTCYLRGYAKVQFLSRSGKVLGYRTSRGEGSLTTK